MKNQNYNYYEDLKYISKRLDNEIIILNPLRYLPFYMIFNKLSCNYNLYYIKKLPFTSYFQENLNSAKEVSRSMIVKTKIGIILPLYMTLDYFLTDNSNKFKEFLYWHLLCSFAIPYYFMNLTTKLISPLSFSKDYEFGKLKFNIISFTTYFVLIHLLRKNKHMIFSDTKNDVVISKKEEVKVISKTEKVLEVEKIKNESQIKPIINTQTKKADEEPIISIVEKKSNILERYSINLVFDDKDVKCVINKL